MSTLITIVLAVCTIAANAAVNITIKFSPDAATASHALKAMALKVVTWVMNALTVLALIDLVLSPAPVTRVVVFEIAFLVAAILFVVLSSQLNLTLQLLYRMVRVADRHAQITGKIVTVLERGRDDRSQET